MGGEVVAASATISLGLLGSGVVPPDPFPVAMLSVVLLTLLDLGAKCPGLQLLALESARRSAQGG